MGRVYVKTLGCKVNSYDSDELETKFAAEGYEVSKDPKDADITVLNTCSVTSGADREARYYLRRFRKDNPEALVVATGCYAQTDSEKLLQMPEVDFVFPNEVKERVAKVSDSQLKLKRAGQPFSEPRLPKDLKPVAANKQGHFKSSLEMLPTNTQKTRAFLKIQDGCNGFCSYCLIPYARGASRSVQPDQVLKEVRRLIDEGTKEIVFAGIHIGDYGRDLDGAHPSRNDFVELIKELFSWEDMVRLRISSLEPRELPEELLKALAQRSELFCDHFHLPLQAGHDRILKLMRRSYTTSQYAETVAMARSYFPRANFGADIIPGFPGETEEEFLATTKFIEDCGLNYLHVFPYSKRPNTAAARLPDHHDAAVVKERAKALRDLSQKLEATYEKQFFGCTLEVLWEDRFASSGQRLGRTKNYLDVIANAKAELVTGQITEVKLKGKHHSGKILGISQN